MDPVRVSSVPKPQSALVQRPITAVIEVVAALFAAFGSVKAGCVCATIAVMLSGPEICGLTRMGRVSEAPAKGTPLTVHALMHSPAYSGPRPAGSVVPGSVT